MIWVLWFCPLLVQLVVHSELWIVCSRAVHLHVVFCGWTMQWEVWWEDGHQICVPLFQWRLSVVLPSIFLMLGISKYFHLNVSFVMCWSFTSVILMPTMRRMLQCRNTSIFFRRDVRSAHISHTHSNRLIGMAIKISYLLRLSSLASVQNLARAPIDAFPAARRASML